VGEHTLDEALHAFEQAEAAAAPVYRMSDVFADPHYQARHTLIRVDDEELGSVAMADVVPRMSRTQGVVRWAGRPGGSANAAVYGGLLGLGEDEQAALRDAGVI
jgi:crotonobetainyl-CoA:carnitine CoA-transferase CaiB-like acyl-CoA transferase